MLCILATGRKQPESNMAPAFGGSGVDWDAPLAAFAPLQVTTSCCALSVENGVVFVAAHTACLHILLQY
jgi:hypothetical protein